MFGYVDIRFFLKMKAIFLRGYAGLHYTTTA